MRLPLLPRAAGLALLAAPLLLTACDSSTGGAPRRAVVTAVQIDDGPLLAVDGSQWDGTGGGGPEIYFRLYYDGDDIVANPGDDVLNPRDDRFVVNVSNPDQPWYDDIRSTDFPLIWDIDGGFEVRDLRQGYRVALFDHDPIGGDDAMISTRAFTFDEEAPTETDGREDTIVLEGAGSDQNLVQVRLRIVYES